MRRRRARCGSAVDRLAPRGASALQAWLWLLVFIFQNEFRISDSIQPGYLDFDNLPDTNFTCTGKVIGGYYADLETSCQMFHVCTVGQGDEPMDIKFLCLNGTVFDQETRVCERVDEVDCTKSEKFYSLNLELYGSTVPPAIEPERDSSQDQSHNHKQDTTQSPSQPDPAPNPTQEQSTQSEHHTEHVEPMEDNIEPEEEEKEPEEEDEYEEYTVAPALTTTSIPSTTTTSSPRSPTTDTPTPPTTSPASTPIVPTYGVPLDPTLLTPQEFTFHHSSPPRAPASAASPPQAVSFQQNNFPHHSQTPRLTLTAHHPASPAPPPPPTSRPADHVFITAAPDPHHYSELEQIDHYELYESAKNSPRRPHDHPAPFLPSHASRLPQGFRPATGQPPRSQIQSPGQYQQRPVQSYQPSERHEILYEEHYRTPSIAVPTYDYDRYHFDRKRSHNVDSIHTEPTEMKVPIARSVAHSTTATTIITSEKSAFKTVPKSPPRVIVTASASVSDSNGKKLNYTVGNVVKAVKPIVPINYDDYKESDLIFDPFFLDVPKLTRRRNVNGSKHDLGKRNAVITLLATEVRPLAIPPSPTSRPALETTTAWIPPDYVDDNYEPQSYVEAPPPEVHNAQKDYPKTNILKKDSVRDEGNLKEVFKSQKVDKSPEAKVTSSQSPQKAASRVTERTTKLVVKHSSGHNEVAKLLARSPALRPLLSALPTRGDYNVVRVNSKPSDTFSCNGKKLYELYADEHECRTFHVCARPSLHLTLRCGLGLYFKYQARECSSVIGNVVCNNHRLDHV